MATARKNREDRLDRGAWVDAALNQLGRTSIDNVRVEPLAKALGVTKGSFYWHFQDREELLQAMLDKWRRKATSDVIERLETDSETPEETVRKVLQLSFQSKHPGATTGAAIEFGIRNWARRDPSVAAAVSEVDEQRMRFNIQLFRKMGFDEDWSAARAFLVYCFNFGDSIISAGEHSREDLRRIGQLCIDYLSQPNAASEAD